MWELLTVWHDTDAFRNHRNNNNEDLMFLISNVTLNDRMLKGLCDFMGANPSRQFINLQCLVAIPLVEVEI